MAQKVNNRTLFILFGGLLLVVVAVQWWQAQKPESAAIRETTIEPVDSSKITRIQFLPAFDTAKAYSLVPTDTGWQVQNKSASQFNENRFQRAMEELKNGIPISHLVSRKKADWEEYEVDSSGTLLKVYQEGKLYDKAVLGKMDFSEKQKATTYVRHAEQPSVYAVSSYLEGSLKGKVSDWLQQGGRGPGGRQLSPKMRRKIRQMRQKRQQP